MDMPAVEAPVLDRPGFSVGTSTFGPAGFSGSGLGSGSGSGTGTGNDSGTTN